MTPMLQVVVHEPKRQGVTRGYAWRIVDAETKVVVATCGQQRFGYALVAKHEAEAVRDLLVRRAVRKERA